MKKRQLELEIMVRERTAEVVQQKEEISTQHDNLREVNALLQEHQEEIQAQAEELFEANVELQKLNSTKDKFFSIIAHDLKNPFHAISGFSDMLLKDFDEIQHEKAREFLTVIRNSSKTASSLLENLLTWARTQTNKVQHNPQTIDFHNIAQENTNLLKANANNKNIALSNNVKQGTFIFADNNMITTVIRNLVNNAIKFTPGGGKVTISAKQADTHIEIAVSDTGVGIDEISRNKLFKIDQQHTTSGTSGEEGTGLGLVICKEFVEKNEGEIRIESTPGKGSSFIINLPASNQNMSIAEPEKKIEKPVIETQPEKIIPTNNPDEDTNTDKPIVLIVDDSNDIRLHIKANLEKKYKTVEAKNGNEGEKFAFDIIPDLIISDWMMPQMDGIKLAQKLKNDERTSHIPIIMLTAKSTASSQVEGLETGADDFITKPFDNNVLKARVKNLIQSRRKLQEKFAGVTKDYVQPSEIKVSSIDEKFIKKAIGAVEKNMSDQQFDTEELGKTIGMSRAQLYRKLTAVTGQSPSKFIRTLRVKRAAQLLEQDGGNISEVMYMVGFNNRSYFAKCFKEVFGVIPSEYKK